MKSKLAQTQADSPLLCSSSCVHQDVFVNSPFFLGGEGLLEENGTVPSFPEKAKKPTLASMGSVKPPDGAFWIEALDNAPL